MALRQELEPRKNYRVCRQERVGIILGSYWGYIRELESELRKRPKCPKVVCQDRTNLPSPTSVDPTLHCPDLISASILLPRNHAHHAREAGSQDQTRKDVLLGDAVITIIPLLLLLRFLLRFSH